MTKGEKTRQRIFTAAIDEFAEHGYEGARVARISEQAGVNKERIYAHFENKENLFIEVWKHTYQLILSVDNSFLELTEEQIPDLGSIILSRYMQFHEDHPEFWKIFAWENLLQGKHNSAITGLKQPFHAHLKQLYQRGQQTGQFRKTVSFETFMFIIISISFTFASNKATMSETLGLDFKSDDIKSQYLKECNEFLFRDPGTESPAEG